MTDYIGAVYQQVKLKEGIGAVERLLVSAYFLQPISTKELARHNLLPIPVVTAVKKEFIKLGVLEQNKGVATTPLGRRYVEEACGFGGIDLALYGRLLESPAEREALVARLAGQLTPIYEGRPQVDVTIDQAKGTVETALRRALLCLEKGALIGKKVLCVGDDDLVSVAVGFVLRELYPGGQKAASVCVLDMDSRFTGYIGQVAEAHGLPITCVELDLKDPLPLHLTNSFDCFFTDPPYTTDGMALFLSRGVSALKKERGLKVFLSYGQKPVEETFEVQEAILQHGLLLLEVHKNFNQYEGAASLGNRSQMMVLESTDRMKAVIAGVQSFRKGIYTGDLRAPQSRYRCKGCGETLVPGQQGAGRTVEELKQKGCPHCGHHSFDLVRKAKPQGDTGGEKKSLGVHILADFFGCSREVLRNEALVKTYMHQAAKKANASIVFEEFHTFSPWGVSGAIIIKESHLTIHTWPEYAYAAVDLFTCGDSLNLWKALEYLKKKLECDTMEYTNVARGVFRHGGVDSSEQVAARLEQAEEKEREEQ